MYIKEIKVSLGAEQKIYEKHGIERAELEDSLHEGKPLFFKTKQQRYVAFTKKQRFITIIFEFHAGIAEIITAYPSSEWQIRLYKRQQR